MPLENILQVLDAEAEKQITEIEEAAQAKCEQILAQAESEAAATREKQQAEAQNRLEQEKARLLNRARLEAAQRDIAARNDLVEAALKTAADRLADLPRDEVYGSVLRQLTRQAVGALHVAGELRLKVIERDVELMEQLMAEMDLSATVESGLQNEDDPLICGSLGGVDVTTVDGRIRLSNTLAVRLRQIARHHRAQIAAILFNHQDEA